MACHLVTSHLVKVVRLHGATPNKAGSEWSVDCEFEDLAHPGSEEVSLQQTSIAVVLEDVADCDARAGVPNMSGEFTPGRAAAGIVTGGFENTDSAKCFLMCEILLAQKLGCSEKYELIHLRMLRQNNHFFNQ